MSAPPSPPPSLPASLPMAPPVPVADYDSPTDRATRRRERAVGRTLARSRWWWWPMAVVLVLMGMWGVLRADQFLSGILVWPRQGARFVEVSASLPTGSAMEATGGPMTVVISGLNTKSGTAVATALLPALAADGGRVFSLVYGSGIADEDLVTKYDALVATVRPDEVTFFGSSMGGDIALNLAAHAHRLRQQQLDARAAERRQASAGPFADAPILDGAALRIPAAVRSTDPSPAAQGTAGIALSPRVSTVYLDCSPLAADDVRDRSRTSADILTTLTEAAGTDGGAATRVVVEVMAQRRQWSSGLLPAVSVRGDDLLFKYRQVMREKISSPGISTALVKDQYGVIRRMDAEARFAELGAGAEPVRIVYFRPVVAAADTVVAVERVTRELGRLAAAHGVEVRAVGVPDGHHASAQTVPQAYLAALATPFPGVELIGEPTQVTVLAAGRR